MEVALIFALIGVVASLMSISIAHSYKIVIEAGVKKRVLEHDKETVTQIPINASDDLQQRLEQFRRERFAPVARRQVDFAKKE